LGETIVVIGLGLIGLVTAELLKANGCRVIGYDPDLQKVDMALHEGILAFNLSQGNDPVKFIKQETNEIGADGVIITASNKNDEIIHQAAEMSRTRGRIILVGVIGLNMLRDDFYKKELTFQVSCSYGPGRYDENYEQKGHDYPIGYVRWTEKRNFETILNAISTGQLDVKSLITERVPLKNYEQIYGDMRKQGSIASILVYPTNAERTKTISINNQTFEGRKGVFGIIGAGNFTSSTIIPGMKAAGANMKYIASAGGLTAKILAKKGNISIATSDYHEILNDKEVDTVMVTTRHNLHAKMVIESLQAGKNVFVEKPLCLTEEELQDIITAQHSTLSTHLLVGFNRRFAPLAQKMKQLLGEGPKNIVATMNAGFIPPNLWVHDPEVGGGRIIGEACHYIDLCTFLAGSKITAVCMNSMGTQSQENTDNASILLKYDNGTNAVINYFANGSKAYSKERIEVYNQEKTLILDNWRILRGYGTKGFSRMKTKLDKGHKNQFRLLVESIQKGGHPIISFDEIVNTTRASFAAIKSLKENRWIEVE
jgi:predicted dehydrogenase